MKRVTVIDGGATIQTHGGLQFHILDPRLEEIDIQDIAHALSNVCRFSGHSTFPYSVAQHSILVSMLVSPGLELEGLLHDAAEAYIGDMSRPMKYFTEAGKHFLEIESRIDAAIRKKYGLLPAMPDEVKRADNALLYAEKEALLPPVEWTNDWGKNDLSTKGVDVRRWSPRFAKAKFIERFQELTRKGQTAR